MKIAINKSQIRDIKNIGCSGKNATFELTIAGLVSLAELHELLHPLFQSASETATKETKETKAVVEEPKESVTAVKEDVKLGKPETPKKRVRKKKLAVDLSLVDGFAGTELDPVVALFDGKAETLHSFCTVMFKIGLNKAVIRGVLKEYNPSGANTIIGITDKEAPLVMTALVNKAREQFLPDSEEPDSAGGDVDADEDGW